MKKTAYSTKLIGACLLFCAAFAAHAAITDLAGAPLVTSPTSSILPNVFLMMDDSGSMAWDYMPDNAGNFNSPAFGGASSQCNGIYYDPTLTYTPPATSAGASYPASSFTAAWTDGYNTGAGTTNLSTSFVPSGGGTAAPAYYYKYTGTQTTPTQKNYYNTASQFYTECNSSGSGATITLSGSGNTTVSSIKVNGVELLSASASGNSRNNLGNSIVTNITLAGYTATYAGSIVTITAPSTASAGFTPAITSTAPGISLAATAFPTTTIFTKVVVSATSGPGASDERTNFANWYSYYRTRINMMKTATGLAFKPIGSTFRVGFATMNNNGGTDFINLNTFDATQRTAWYNKLYAASTGSSTPLLGALADVGKMYAHKLATKNSVAVVDPIQYSCQQNFTILTTDGFWNSQTGNSKLDGTTPVGNQDGIEVRPMYDGANQTLQKTVTDVTTTRQQSVQNTNTSVGWTRNLTTAASPTKNCVIGAGSTSSTCVQDNGANSVGAIRTWCMVDFTTTTASTAADCIGYFNTAPNALCRGRSLSTNIPSPSASGCIVDSTGATFCVYNNTTTPGTTACFPVSALAGSWATSNVYACQNTTATTGYTVTTQPQTYTQSTNSAITTVTDYPVSTTTQTAIVNGVASTPVITTATGAPIPVSITTTVTSTNGAPSGTTAWSNNGGAVTSCVAGPPPASGSASAPVAGASTTANVGTPTVTTASVTTVPGTPVTSISGSGGTSDTLADVAEYYYVTDLRTVALNNNLSAAPGAVNGTDISTNNVPVSGLDAAAHQHMTTFTLGLGARGSMVFDPNYQSATTGDFYAVKQGSSSNGTTICSWQASGTTCNWPIPVSNGITTVDDLWHAAVDGRGTYFSATNPADLSLALSSALAGVSARTGAAAAATTSNAFVTQGDNFLFRSTYVTQDWTGELVRQQLNVTSGQVLSTIDWRAQPQLDAHPVASRSIYFFNPLSATKLSGFIWANLSVTLQAYFSTPYLTSNVPTMSQLCTTTAANCLPVWAASTFYPVGSEYRVVSGATTTWYHVNTAYTSLALFGATDLLNTTVITGATDANLVNFIRGDRTNEGVLTDTTKYFRQRGHVLGDIVNAESVYVRSVMSPGYTDPGFTNYTASVSSRQPMVYVAANDGMLHAFYGTTGSMDSVSGNIVTIGGVAVTGGDEAWAFIPTAVMPNLYKLADKNYGTQHQYFVDGSPVAADVCASACGTASAVWKTILVGGLNKGGKSYYALDVTNPAHPVALWEFSDTNMGYTFGNPKVVKLKTGQWVVLVSSGYNNVPDGTVNYTAADGIGRMYVIDALTGTLATSVNTTGIISTGAGSVATPSGLADFDAPLLIPGIDATATAVYAGDLLGNLWRFDINGDLGAAGFDAQLMASLRGPTNLVQPITSKPLLSLVGSTVVVYVGTGQYLGSSDINSTSGLQSFYAIKDTYPATSTPSVAIFGNPRTQGTFVQQTQTSTTCPPGSPPNVCTTGQSVVVSTNTAVNFSSNGGWFFDFPLAGERVNTDPAIINGTLVITTNVPSASACSVGGDSYQYMIDYKTGGSVSSSTTGVTAIKLGNELSTRPVVATLGSGTSSSGNTATCDSQTNIAYTQGSGGNNPTASTVWTNCGGGGGTTVTGVPNRRSWRELIRE